MEKPQKLTKQSIKIHFPIVIALLHLLHLAANRLPSSRRLRLYCWLSCRATLTSDYAAHMKEQER